MYVCMYTHVGPIKSPGRGSAGSSPGQGKKSKGGLHSSSSSSNGVDGKCVCVCIMKHIYLSTITNCSVVHNSSILLLLELFNMIDRIQGDTLHEQTWRSARLENRDIEATITRRKEEEVPTILTELSLVVAPSILMLTAGVVTIIVEGTGIAQGHRERTMQIQTRGEEELTTT